MKKGEFSMPRVLHLLLALGVLFCLAISVEKGQAGPPGQMAKSKILADGMSKALRALREDIDIDLPDARGAKVGAIVDQSVYHVRDIQRGVKAGLPAPQLHKLSIELDKSLDLLVDVTTKMGSDAYYLRKSAVEINHKNERLAHILSPATISPRVFILTDLIVKNLEALRDDIDVDLPDPRGVALSKFADHAQKHARHIHRGARFGARPDLLRKEAGELAQELDLMIIATKKLGADGYYLNKSAVRIQPLALELIKALSP